MWVVPIWKVCPLSTAFVSDSKQLDEGRFWSFHWALKTNGVPEVLSSDLGDKVTFLETVLSFLLHFLLPCSIRVNFKLFWAMSTVVIVVKCSWKWSFKESSDDKLKAILQKWSCVKHTTCLSLQSAKNAKSAHIHLSDVHHNYEFYKGRSPFLGPAQFWLEWPRVNQKAVMCKAHHLFIASISKKCKISTY